MVHVPESVHRLAVEVEGWLDMSCPERALAKMDQLFAAPGARPAALLLRIRAYVELERHEDALKDLEELRTFDHDPEQADLTEAWCRKRLDDLVGAAACMRRLIKRSHRSAIGHFNLGCYLALMGESRAALDEVSYACGIDKDYRKLLAEEDDLASLRGLPAFEELVLRD